ncbi:RNA polymerase sigma factor [Negadavirga shengliensis]|uniref:RNA polymerase sigma factor n=1 Tax=Negadavirga shengliensis TaxID=1389218 RepID=A0ABV9SZ93_9BACT
MADFNVDDSSGSAFDEKECWRRIKLGDKTGLEGLYALFAKELMAFGLSIAPNRSLVKDCIQELFIEIWRYRKNGVEVKNVKMYVFKALANKIKKEIVRESNRHAKEQAEGLHALYFRNDSEMGIIHLQKEEMVNQRLLDALDKLPSRQKEVIRYVFFENLSNDQISKLMGINVQSVYTLTWKAICNLRKHYLVLLFLLLLA